MIKKQNVESSSDFVSNCRRTKKALSIFGLSLLIFIIFVCLGFWGYEKVYAEKIYPGVKIAQYNAGGEPLTQIKDLVNYIVNQEKSKRLKLVGSEQYLTPTFEEIGIEFNVDQIIEDAFDVGRDKSFWQRFQEKAKAVIFSEEIALVPKINEEKFTAYINANSDLNKVEKDASLRVEHGQAITVLSETGSKVDIADFKAKLIGNFQDQNISRTIVLKLILINPKINEDQIENVKPRIEKIINTPIELTYNSRTYIADADIMINWIVLKLENSGVLNIEFSDDKIREFIDSASAKINQKKIDRKINAVSGEVIEEGRDGLEVNTGKMLAMIKEILITSGLLDVNRNLAIEVSIKERDEKKIQPEELPQEGGTSGLYAGRYLEVNLSEQKLYAFDGTNLAGAYQVSTGKWSMPTPIGTRYIESKSERAYSAKYDLYMPYWNSIGGGYGIHELPEWANGYKEGEAHLGTPVSHGCIRLGVGPAEFIFNWAPVGAPVYIHK